MRHIPEDELHAYLDQALSRSQCIEIETHLAYCGHCADVRDDIAALRDRTTALLDGAAPRRIARGPTYEVLLERAVSRRQRSWRRMGLAAAAAMAAMLGASWGFRPSPEAPPSEVLAVSAPPVVDQESPPAVTSARVVETDPAPIELPPLAPDPTRFSDTEVRLVGRGPSPSSSAPAPVSPSEVRTLALDALWVPVSLFEAEEATGSLVPMVPDLPIVEIRMRQGSPRERPLLVVTQRHPSAGMIHTVEGPGSQVAQFVEAQLHPGVDLNSSDASRSPPDYLEAAGTIRRTQRVLAVMGNLSVDSLNLMATAVVMR